MTRYHKMAQFLSKTVTWKQKHGLNHDTWIKLCFCIVINICIFFLL